MLEIRIYINLSAFFQLSFKQDKNNKYLFEDMHASLIPFCVPP
jgi:hypothetical protein